MLIYANVMTYVSFKDDLCHFVVFPSYVPSVVVNWVCVLCDKHVDVALSFLHKDRSLFLKTQTVGHSLGY